MRHEKPHLAAKVEDATNGRPTSPRPSIPPRRRLPLAIVLVVPFLLQLLAVIGFTAWLSLRHGEEAVETTTRELRQEIGRRTQAFLFDALITPQMINELNAQAVALDELDLKSPEALGMHFRQQLDTFPNVSFIFFGSVHGGAAGAGRQPLPASPDAPSRSPQIVATVDTTPVDANLGLIAGTRFEYLADAYGSRLELLRSNPGFDSRERPWYRQAKLSGDAVWTPVYPLFFDHSLALAASRPVWNADGELLGVLGVDLRLEGIQRFLDALEVGETGEIFILERDGLLIASSTDDDLLVDPLQDNNWTRRPAVDSQAPLVRQASTALLEHFGELTAIDGLQQLTFDLLGQRHYLEVLPLRDGRGIDWLIVIAMPRSDFTAPLEISRRRTLWLMAVGLLMALILGGLTARSLTRPIRRLDAASRQLAAGALTERAAGGGSREIDALAGAFNSMAEQLQSSFEHLEQRVAQRTEELRQAKDVAEAADRAKSRFLANVSHELRTPLSTVLGYAELLAGAPRESPERQLYLETVQRQGRHLSRLLSDLIDLGGIEAGSFELHSGLCRLQDLIEQLRSLFAPQAADKGLRLVFETPQALPWTFHGDATRLLQILSNLLSNAIRYTRQGEVRCRITSEPTIEASTSTDLPLQARLRFEVQDTGLGIADADRHRLFQHFVRLPEGESAAAGGFGLGLAITRQLCTLMDGTLELESTLGTGSCFTVTVPVEQCEEWQTSPPAESWRPKSDTSLPPLRGKILIVDDSPPLRTLCQHMLGGWGLTCTLAADGHQAIDAANRQSFDAILMDWQMPGLDGLAATETLRQQGIVTPIIALTASVMAGDRERCLQAGCSHYLVKPIDFHHLHTLFSDLLRGHTAESVLGGLPNDPEIQALIAKFVRHVKERLEPLRQRLAVEDWSALIAAGHRLAGTAGSYGLSHVESHAKALETAAQERQADDCHHVLQDLEQTVQSTIDSLP